MDVSDLAAALADHGITRASPTASKSSTQKTSRPFSPTLTLARTIGITTGATREGRENPQPYPCPRLPSCPGNRASGTSEPPTEQTPENPGMAACLASGPHPSPLRTGVIVTTTDPAPNTPSPTSTPGSDDDQEARDAGIAQGRTGTGNRRSPPPPMTLEEIAAVGAVLRRIDARRARRGTQPRR